MTDNEKRVLATAAIPLEVLVSQINQCFYQELSNDIQRDLIDSLDMIRALLFPEIHNPKLKDILTRNGIPVETSEDFAHAR